MTIGDLARRLRVSTRALRHYESVGLLRPAHVDRRSGYRYYGDAELARGLRIEQLKAAGLPLASIARILDDEVPMVEALTAHRSHLLGTITEHRRHLAMVDSMLDSMRDAIVGATERPLTPELVEVGAAHALVVDGACAPDELAGTIRRLVQRLRRDAVRRLGISPTMYSARFPLQPAREMATRVAAHVAMPCDGSVVLDGVTAIAVDVVGTHALLSIAQDAAVAEANGRGLRSCGWVWEHYLDIGYPARTRLLLPVADGTDRIGRSVRSRTGVRIGSTA
jgi:DNA-binding transcriptional MerR regulator